MAKQQAVTQHGAGWLFFVGGLVLMLFVGWVLFPKVLYCTKTQPFEFSHVTHGPEGTAGNECTDCHAFREDGSYQGIPPLSKCMECHEDLMGESEAEREFQEKALEMAENGEQVPWLIYSKQPICVYFSHAAHVKMAELECTACHPDVTNQKVPPPYVQNRITGYSREVWDRMKMSVCGDCHKKQGANNACFVCHK